MAKMNRNRNDVIAKIKTARAEAQTRVNAYENIATKRYDHWQALATVIAYHGALALFEQASEHKIPDMAAEAVADFERARDRNGGTPVPTVNLAVADGRRDALASIADWMNAEDDS